MALPALSALPELPTLPALPSLPGTTDLKTSDGLYALAKQNKLQSQADNIVKMNSGEETKKIFSGGFISDAFDVLNMSSYGVVGMLKGKSFLDGVENRESFADQDALGKYGLVGMVGGIALDIATDPLTYIAPWTILKNVPGLAKGAKAVKTFALGKAEQRLIEDGLGRTFETFAEPTKLQKATKWLADKVVWMYGQDPVFRETYERSIRNIGIQTVAVANLLKPFAKIDPAFAEKLLVRTPAEIEGGVERFARKDIGLLQRELTTEQFDQIKPIWDKIDAMGQELVDLGVLGEGKFEENFGSYIKNAYTDYETALNKNSFGSAKTTGIKGTKVRKEGLTQESATAAGQIDNPHYLLGVTMLQMSKDIENAKLFKSIATNFGTDTAQEGFTKLPDTRRLQTTAGSTAEMATRVKAINTQLKPLFKDLRSTFKADKKVMSQIDNLEKQIAEMSSKRAEELTKFFSEGSVGTKVVAQGRRLGTISEALTPISNKVKTFETYDEMINSDVGIALEKLDVNGDLQRQGFKSMQDFFDFVKNPYKEASSKVVPTVAEGDMKKIIQLQKQVEQLTAKSTTLSEIDKRSINDSFRSLERQISGLTETKTGLKEAIQTNKLGDLAGKYIPADMEKYINEIAAPSSELGNKLIGEFKYMKVVLSPSTHVRNVMSNMILNWWKLGVGPWRQDLYFEALQDVRKGGVWSTRAAKVGLGGDTYAANELKGLLDSPEMSQGINRFGRAWQKVKKTMGGIYQEEENIAKLVAFKAMVKKGLTDDEAWKAAESATFNYAQVTPFVRKLRTAIWGVPFITFPLKAVPIVAETALKNTQRMSFFGKLRDGLDQQGIIGQTEAERKSEPQYMKDGFFIKLPMKDAEGRSAYFDLTYVLPFGTLISGQVFNRQMSRETGLKQGIPESAISNNPVLGLLGDLTKNQDFYGNQIFKDSDETWQQLADITNYVGKMMSPPIMADQMPGGYNSKGERVPTGIAKSTQAKTGNESLNIYENMLKYIGLKVQPVDAQIQSSINEHNTKMGLQTLLKENGVVSDFSSVYQPK